MAARRLDGEAESGSSLTIADLENIMDKFKNDNPDGLAPSEVSPLAISLKNNTWMGSLDWLFGAYGTIEEQWNKDADGNLEYGSINPGAKQALTNLSEWMEKGYIHTNSALWDEGKSAPSGRTPASTLVS